jgi:hypothetical protein
MAGTEVLCRTAAWHCHFNTKLEAEPGEWLPLFCCYDRPLTSKNDAALTAFATLWAYWVPLRGHLHALSDRDQLDQFFACAMLMSLAHPYLNLAALAAVRRVLARHTDFGDPGRKEPNAVG